MVAAQRGYRCVFVMPDKMSREKIALLRAFGAEVVVCPTEVEPEDPRSYYSVSRRWPRRRRARSTRTSTRTPAIPQAHYDSTGPEIWEQLGDELDVLVDGRRHRRHGYRHGPLPQGAASPACRSSAPIPIGSIYSSEQVALLSRRGRRRGLLADDVRPRHRRPLDPRVRSRGVRRRRAGSRASRAS